MIRDRETGKKRYERKRPCLMQTQWHKKSGTRDLRTGEVTVWLERSS